MDNFFNNQAEKKTGLDLNADGFVGGEGLAGKIEKVTHVDLNGDGIIGRIPDTFPGGVYPQGNPDPYGGGSSGYNQGSY